MGTERRSLIICSERETRTPPITRPAIPWWPRCIPGTDPIHKVTIIPRGRALGVTQQLPIDEQHTYSKEYLARHTLTVLLGGRAAEELIFQHFTTGAGNDIERATEMARKMVCEWGMSDELGPVTFGKKDEQIFLGREISQGKDYSEETARVIDHAIKNLVFNAYSEARELLTTHKPQLEALARTLIEKETLDSAEIDRILDSFKKPADTPDDPELAASLPLGLQQA